MVRRAVTGKSVMDELSGPPLNLTPDEIKQRFRGTLFGPDGEQTCAVVTLTDEAKRDLKTTIAVIQRTASQECGISAEELKLGGPPVVNQAIDVASARSLRQLAGLSGIVGLFIAWWCFRTVKLTLLVVFAGVYSAMCSMAVVAFSGQVDERHPDDHGPAGVRGGHERRHPPGELLSRSRAGEGRLGSGGTGHPARPIAACAGHQHHGRGLAVALVQRAVAHQAVRPVLRDRRGDQPVLAVSGAPLRCWISGRNARARQRIRRTMKQETGEAPLPVFWQKFAEHGHGSLRQSEPRAASACWSLCLLGLPRIETSIKIMRFFSPNTPDHSHLPTGWRAIWGPWCRWR